MKTSATIHIGVHKKSDQHSFRFLSNFLTMLVRYVRKFFHYIRYVFRPAKELTPEGIKKLEEITADDNNPNSFSPVFTTTKDAADWLNS